MTLTHLEKSHSSSPGPSLLSVPSISPSPGPLHLLLEEEGHAAQGPKSEGIIKEGWRSWPRLC